MNEAVFCTSCFWEGHESQCGIDVTHSGVIKDALDGLCCPACYSATIEYDISRPWRPY